MNDIRISEIFIPLNLPYKKEKLSVLIPSSTKEFKLYLNQTSLEQIPEYSPNILLLHDDIKIASKFENFDFLKTTYKFQEQDDWVTFYLADKNLQSDHKKLIKIRFSGRIIIPDLKYLKLSTKELNLIAEKPESHEESNNSSAIEKNADLQIYEKEINCEYIKQINKIELCFKSMDCLIKRIQCYDGLDFYNIPENHSNTTMSIPCKLDFGQNVLNVQNEKDLQFILASFKLTEKFVLLQIEEIEMLKMVSARQDDRFDQMNSARRSIKNDFIENIEDIENLLNELGEQNFSIDQFCSNLSKENEEKMNKKRMMEKELQDLKSEQIKIEESLAKEALRKLKGVQDERNELEQTYFHLLGTRSALIAENKEKVRKINEEISKALQNCSEIEQENVKLDSEIDDLKKTSFQHKVKYYIQSLKPEISNQNISANSLKSIQDKKSILKQESVNILKNISLASRNLRLTGYNLQKSLDSQTPQLNSSKFSDLQLTTSKPTIKFPLKFLPSYSLQERILNSYNFKLIHNKQVLAKVSSQINHMLEIQKLQKDLYTTIACDIKPVYLGNDDQIDKALSEFLNKNRSICPFQVLKKSYGQYTINNKTVSLCIHNNKLTIKSAGSFIPIKDYIIDLKRRSSSLTKRPF